MEAPVNKSRWLVVCLTLIPLWLALSAGVAVWWSFQTDDKEEEERNQRFAMEMSVERIAGDMRKLDEVIGPRHLGESENLIRAAAMIDGTLGPSNTGYKTRRIPAPKEMPIIRASLEQKKNGGRCIWVVAAYDTYPSDTSTSKYSSSVAAAIAAAQAMAKDDLPTDIHFLFLPYGNFDMDRMEIMLSNLPEILNKPVLAIHVGSMINGSELIAHAPKPISNDDLSAALGGSPLPNPPPVDLSSLQGLGTIDQSLGLSAVADELHLNGLPVVQVSTQSNPSSASLADAENIAISTGKLVEWLRRAARLEASN